MNRNVKIYRKLLYKISRFCTYQKFILSNCKFYGNDKPYCGLNGTKTFSQKFETDFERGWFHGYHAAMNDVLREIDDRVYWANNDWNVQDNNTR